MKTDLWVEKYRPSSLKGYVFQDKKQENIVKHWIESKSIPHVLFSGSPGVGKTALARIILKELNVDDLDIKVFNGSHETGVDYLREVIGSFCSTMPFGDKRYILVDEADYMSINAQACLRHMMESYADTSRFILTCNYPNKIIPALHSRCQEFHVDKLDKKLFQERVVEILLQEGVEIDDSSLDSLARYIENTFPDMRKCLNTLQQNCIDGKILPPEAYDASNSTLDYIKVASELFKQRKYAEGREVICKNVSGNDYEEIFRFMYKNLGLWCDNKKKLPEAIIIIRNGIAKIPLVADQEINLSATLCELELLNS